MGVLLYVLLYVLLCLLLDVLLYVNRRLYGLLYDRERAPDHFRSWGHEYLRDPLRDHVHEARLLSVQAAILLLSMVLTPLYRH